MLLELAIGDAYGASFEYVSRRMIREQNTLAGYVQHPRHGIRPGCYTDDAQMSIAIAELLVVDAPWTRENIAQQFVTAFKRDPREGYARGFYGFLQEVQDGTEFLAHIKPHSDKSGAAMRAAPLGVLPDVAMVVERCTVQAALTHDTPDGINAAVAAALMAHYFIYKCGPKAEVGEFVASHVPGPWTESWTGKVGAKGWMSVQAAITVIQQHDSLSAMLKACVDFSGDADTVASIALAAAACSDEIDQDLPAHLINDLENGPYGRDYIVDLDRRLIALAVVD
ncbi:MAG: ADP-ribosylglycohydrolase family protein [Anaerolineae bacterium]|nr:ADP-ribosylglycohydrolase family protein [Anaerolineae bacterium]